MRLKHTDKIAWKKPHELSCVTDVWSNRPQQCGRLAILDQLEAKPPRERRKCAYEVLNTVAKSSGIQYQVPRQPRSGGARAQSKAMAEILIAAATRHYIEIGDVLAEGRLQSGAIDNRQRHADRAENRLG